MGDSIRVGVDAIARIIGTVMVDDLVFGLFNGVVDNSGDLFVDSHWDLVDDGSLDGVNDSRLGGSFCFPWHAPEDVFLWLEDELLGLGDIDSVLDDVNDGSEVDILDGPWDDLFDDLWSVHKNSILVSLSDFSWDSLGDGLSDRLEDGPLVLHQAVLWLEVGGRVAFVATISTATVVVGWLASRGDS